MTNKNIIINENTSLILEFTSLIDELPFADMYVISAICIERGKESETVMYLSAV